jgi:hypothetical protein
MAGVALSQVPAAGRELEDYVAGLFQAAGYFVEKNVRERDGTDVLELDAVATSYDAPTPAAILAEAKGGHWGFPDLFKVAGWMQYLGIARCGFFVKDGGGSARDVARVHGKVARLGVSVVDLGDFSDPSARLDEGGFGRVRDALALSIWRYAFRAERALLDALRGARRAAPHLRGPAVALEYHDLVNDHVFFLGDGSPRLGRLYAAYRSHPKLSAALASELGGGVFDPGATAPRSRLLREAMYEGKHAAVQASFYVEHRARLAILKAAIDMTCHAENPGAQRVAPVAPPAALAHATVPLPASFREGLRRLRERPNFRRYALLWQVFLWGFGGFYLADREDEELGWLATQTGVPRAEVRAGLEAFDILFPLAGGSWLVPLKSTSIVATRMMPMTLRGVGAVQRLRRAGVRDYDGLGYQDYTGRDLCRWHNSLVALLREAAQNEALRQGAAGPSTRSEASNSAPRRDASFGARAGRDTSPGTA